MQKNKVIRLLKQTGTLFAFLYLPPVFAVDVPIDDFSIQSYSQNANDYFPSEAKDYPLSLLKPDYQQAQLQQFYNHYYSSDIKGLSPWSEHFVRTILPLVKNIELDILADFNNLNNDVSHHHYGENFKKHDEIWLKNITTNMDLDNFDGEFKDSNKAIAINNTYARALPDASPDFFHFSLPGQGFPFDNLQESVIWSGTPLYIISVSKNKAWSLVLTPDAYFSWVKSNDIAITSKRFINQWQDAAQKNMVAITQTESSVFDNNHQFQFSSYIGAVFPLVSTNKHISSILIPKKNAQQQAIIALGNILSEQVSVMPLSASKQNLVKLIKQLQNRPYGWGGAFFFNDCSQELKSIFTPLGIWLPRNSFQQAHFTNTIDLSEKSLDERLQILENQGHPLMTLIYIGGHVMLYLGKKPLNTGESAVMTYQNIWGLSPNAKNKRYIIGQSLFFPLLKIYPENPEINSLANTNYFTLIHLDELASESPNPEHFAKQLVHKFSGDNQ